MTEVWTITQINNYPTAQPAEGETKPFSVEWRFEITDGAYTAADYGTQTLEYTHDKDWYAFSALTQPIVIKWVQDALGDDRIAKTKEVLTAMIEQQKHPAPKPQKLPWVA